jgi:nicotinamidase-related amidase
MLTIDNTALLIIDVQENLFRVINGKDTLLENLQKIISGARALGIPILVTEQNPTGLGTTVPELKNLLADIQPVSKFSFSCCGEDRCMEELASLKRTQLLLAGIETHICVYQTALDLLEQGYEVEVLADCVGSRTTENKVLGLEKMKQSGAQITGIEIALFELQRIAKGEVFKEISRMVK